MSWGHCPNWKLLHTGTVHLFSSFSPLTFQLFCLFSFLNIHLSSSSAVIMQQVTSYIPWVNQFFPDLAGFFGYFSRSPKRTSMLFAHRNSASYPLQRRCLQKCKRHHNVQQCLLWLQIQIFWHLTITFFSKIAGVWEAFSHYFLWRHFLLFYCSSMCARRETVHLFSSFSPLTFQLFCLFSFLNIHLSSSSAVIMQQVTSYIPWVNQFFPDLAGFFGYFSRSPKRTSMLDTVLAHRHPRASAVRWNLHICAMNTVFEHKGDIIQCFESIRGSLILPLCVKLEGLWGCWRMIPSASSWNYFIASCLVLTYSSASSRSGPSTQSLSWESCTSSHSFSAYVISYQQ